MTTVTQYIETFKQDYPAYQDAKIDAYAFGGGSAMADELSELVYKGEKCGTTSLYQLYAIEGEKIPQVGALSVILDGQGKPTSVVKNIAVDILKFSDITEYHARLEGEGDKTLNYWREVHIAFFTEECKEIDSALFTEESLVVFETFEVINH